METGLSITHNGQTINVPTDWSNLSVKAWFDLNDLNLDGLTVLEKAMRQFAAGCSVELDLVKQLDPTVFLALFETFKRIFEDELKPEPMHYFVFEGQRYECQFLWAAQGIWDEIAWNAINEGDERSKVTYLANHFWRSPKRTWIDRIKRRNGFQFKDELQYRIDAESALYQIDVRTFHNALFFCSLNGRESEITLKSSILRRCLTLIDEAVVLQLKARFSQWRAKWLIVAVAKLVESMIGRFILTLRN